MIKKRIKALRELFTTHRLDGYIVKTGDEYLSEYTADYAKRLDHITGFSGSNGLVVILKEKAYFYTDGRYLEQSKKELDADLFEIRDIRLLTDLYKDLDIKITIGYDPRLFTTKSLDIFEKINLKPVEENLVDLIWKDQPQRPNSKIFIYPDELSGQNYLEKIALCRAHLNINKAKYLFISKADSICWLLNIRGSDIPFSPLILGYVLISNDEVYLFTDSPSLRGKINDDIKIIEDSKLPKFISKIEDKILIDAENTNSFICSLIKNKQNIQDPCLYLKSCKNEVEINCFINVHKYDGAAVCEFLAYLDKTSLAEYTEYDLANKLTELRTKQPGYISDSFPTICGFQGNGSIIHYNPKKETAKKIIGNGLLLIDSGGQYFGGTTDITRVVTIGNPTEEQKNFYTKVLKGHIALALARFPQGVSGSNLDVLARQFLWEIGEDYAHGTGHGVGACLSVHEGPQSINLFNQVPLKTSMILSNEPGYYKEGEYGIRIENLIYVDSINNSYLGFKNLTMVPYEKKLINFDLLTKTELKYLKNYYQDITKNILPLLSEEATKWLKNQVNIEELPINYMVGLN